MAFYVFAFSSRGSLLCVSQHVPAALAPSQSASPTAALPPTRLHFTRLCQPVTVFAPFASRLSHLALLVAVFRKRSHCSCEFSVFPCAPCVFLNVPWAISIWFCDVTSRLNVITTDLSNIKRHLSTHLLSRFCPTATVWRELFKARVPK